MSNSIVAAVYSHIMKDVVNSVQKDFEENGIDLSVLQDLEKMWESRVAATEVANFEVFGAAAYAQAAAAAPPTENEPTPAAASTLPAAGGVGEFNYYEQKQEGSFNPTDMAGMNYNPMLVSNPGSAQYSASNLANIATHLGLGNIGSNQITTPSPHTTTNNNNNSSNPQAINNGNSFNAQHFQAAHSAQLSNFPTHLQADYSSYPMNALPHGDMYGNPGVDYSIGGTSESFHPPTGPPQLDGTFDSEPEQIKKEVADKWLREKIIKNSSRILPQVDGDSTDLDADRDLDSRLDDNDDDNDEDAINSDLDDSDEAEADDSEKDGITDIILCQYDKVSRTKNRWRCNLKDGVILVNGKDYLFNKATGEFQW